MVKIKHISLSALLMLSTFIRGAQWEVRPDLTQFDYPLLLGDWYLLNSNPTDETQDYAAIRLRLQSDYSFLVQIKRFDNTIEYWNGRYAVDQGALILGLDSEEQQTYHYANSHNRLILEGVTFFKMLSNSISGVWESHAFSGKEKQSSDLQEVLLVLQPDFVFIFKAKDAQGNQVVHNGVYYTEKDHLVLLYEHGEHDLIYAMTDKNTMRIDLEDGAMYAVLNRVN